MATIVTRAGKGAPLTHVEVDANFTNLNTDKIQSGDSVASLDINGGTIDGTVIGGSTPAAISGTTGTFSGNFTVSAGSGNGIFVEDNSNFGSSPFVKVRGNRSDSNTSQSFSGKLLLNGNRTDAAVGNAKNLGMVAFGGNHTDGSAANILYPASISGTSEGTFSNATTMPTALTFFTGSTGRADTTPNVTFGTERMRITSAGLVGIGTSSPAAKLHSFVSSSGASAVAGVNLAGFFEGAIAAAVQISSGAGNPAYLFLGDAANTDATRISSQNGYTQISATGASDYMRFDTGGFNERMRIDASGHLIAPAGITLGTAVGVYSADKTLDDYEEGTWTMEVYDAASGGNASATSTTGYYTKIGRLVTATANISNINTSGMTAGNDVYLTLPFTSGIAHMGSIRIYADVDNATVSLGVFANSSATRVSIVESRDGNTLDNLSVSGLVSGSSDITFTITYQV
jgi:hypothetical protein